MSSYHWKQLSRQQLGACGEYFAKMEFMMHRFQVFTPEVDDRGVDFIARLGEKWLEVQVKTVREGGYIFLQKTKFIPSSYLYAAIVILTEAQPPDLFLICSDKWAKPNALLVSHDYQGLQSKPEWGINISKRNKALLEQYRFDTVVQSFS